MNRPVHFVAGFNTDSTCYCGANLAEQPDELVTLDPDKVTCEDALAALGRTVRPEPDEVQPDGIGAPQAYWLGLADRGIRVTAAPASSPHPIVALQVVGGKRSLGLREARELSESLLAAIEWTGR